MLRLITIPISHYCEKARWALDRAGATYREERHVQGIHRVVARRARNHPAGAYALKLYAERRRERVINRSP